MKYGVKSAWSFFFFEIFRLEVPLVHTIIVAMPNICGDCGIDNDPTAKFCAECGWTFPKQSPPKVNPCGDCGVDNVAAAKFCAECGWTFNGAAASVK